ncbi:hypothetical protein MBAV_000197 [Candidatus Magnetobacterium bavaricum]|uniref:Uncharacterized protein n=1 Tax=Candidatus Magnetobacterium bavaricum TaxID=29290 RepID=A0A0F3H059_9BACT|nr:hypothetical protein MBAV_000197 [Candidatus Magnetobacterium bavaricum]
MRFASLNMTVYYTDGQYNGVIEYGIDRSWGLDIPTGFSVAPVDGYLRQGNYLVAMTFRYGGRESGATMPVTVTCGHNGGILIDNIPNIANTNVESVSIYMSTCNGTELYQRVRFPFGVRQFTITDSDYLGYQLITQLLYPPPVGHLLAVFGGRIYVAEGNALYYCQPFAFELFHQNSFLQFPSRITAIMPMSQGMYVGTQDKVYHLIGLSPEPQPMQVLEVFPYGAVEGTETYHSMKHLGGETVWTWMSTRGVCTGNDQGIVANITESRYSVPSADTGAGGILDRQGFISYLACLPNQNVPEYSVYKRDGIVQVTLPTLQTIPDITLNATLPELSATFTG